MGDVAHDRYPADRRCGVADGGREDRRDADPRGRRRRARRGSGAGGARRRADAVAGHGCAAQRRRMVDHRRQAQGHRPVAPAGEPRHQVRGDGPRARDAGRRGVGSRPHRRRRAAAGVHLGAPGAVARRPDRVDAARGRRPDDRRDRPRVPDFDGDGRGADHPRQEDAVRRRTSRSRCRTARSIRSGCRPCCQRDLPDLQRRLFGVVRAALDP